MPDRQVAARPYALFAACGLALAAASASRGQSDPLSEPFPAVLEYTDIDGTIGFRIDGDVYEEFSGRNVASVGDVNGDGIGDVVFSSHIVPGDSYVLFGRDAAAGAVFPEILTLSDLDGTNGFHIPGTGADSATYSVSGAGDVNGDGLADVIIGAWVANPGGRIDAGAGYIVFGRDSGFPPTVRLADLDGSSGFRMEGVARGDHAGFRVASAGDLNGDGVDDAMIGAWKADPGGRTDAGSIYVVFGRDGGSTFPASLPLADLDGTNGFRIDGIEPGHEIARSFAPAGDVNGDRLDDVIVGVAATSPGDRRSAGASYVLFGRGPASGGAFPAVLSLADIDGTIGFRIDGVAAFDWSGGDVGSAGDVNGDGVGDLIIAAKGADPGGVSLAGSGYVVFGRGDGDAFPPTLQLADLDGDTGFRLDGFGSQDFIGEDVASAGDINGDGLDDIIIGAAYYGRMTFVVYGQSSTSGGFPAVVRLADIDGTNGFLIDETARDFASAGDVNGDGLDDIIIGAPYSDPGGVEDAGSTFILYGRRPASTCPPDLDGDGTLTIFDFLEFGNLFDLMDPRADFDGDGDFTIFDFLAFQNAFDAGCP
ncbi:MAG: integrin alpha [Phycisphaerales bacterium]